MESDVCVFKCGLCQKQFLTDESLLVHQRRNHRASKFVCHYCNHKTNFKFALKKHIERVHLKHKFVCHYCNHRTNFEFALIKHIKRVHLKTKVKKLIKCLTCPLCDLYKGGDRNDMIKHYTHVHDVQLNETTLQFNSYEDFLTWKRDTELRDSCQFISIRGVKKTQDGSIQYLRCSRDGFYRSARKGNRKMKLKGSVKIDAVCPSSIKLHQKTSGPVRATYVGTHVGHTGDVGRLQLSKLERNDIAQKLAARIPVDAILDSIRESVSDGNYSRLHLTTRKDLANIKQSLRNGYSVHSNDRNNVESWVKTQASHSNVDGFDEPPSVLLPDCDLPAKIRNSHDRSLTMKHTFVPTKEGWLVSSESEPEMYEIKKMDIETCDCIAKCKDCDICIHDYQCTCIDAKMSNICKHIHSLVNYVRQTTPSESDEISGELCTQNLEQPRKNLEECKQSLLVEFYNIINSIQTFDEYADVKKSIMYLPHILEARRVGLIFSSNTAVPEKIDSCAKVSPQKPRNSPIPRKKVFGSQTKIKYQRPRPTLIICEKNQYETEVLTDV